MLRRNMSGTNGKGFPFILLSLLHDNLHPSSKHASTMHTDTRASRAEMLIHQIFEVVSVATNLLRMAKPWRKHSRAYLYYVLPYEDDLPSRVVLDISRYLSLILKAANVAARLGRGLCWSTVLHMHMHRPGAEARVPRLECCYLTAHC